MSNTKENVETLQETLLEEEPNVVLDNFIRGKINITALLNVQRMCPQQLVMGLTIIHKACMPANDTNLVAVFLCDLASYKDHFITAVSLLVGKELSGVKTIDNNFLEMIVDLLYTLAQRVPSTSISILEILLPQLSGVCKKCGDDEHVVNRLQELEKQKEACIEAIQSRGETSKCTFAIHDFRLLSNVPSNEEMCSNKPFLRPAIVDGPFENVEHYLDIHFRLMREDMFQDFRKCFSAFYSHKNLENGRMYHNAYIDRVEQTNVGILLYFAVPVRSRVDWKKTKRLAPGSLLCLSCDGFQNFYFASIHSRKDDERNGSICHVALSFKSTNEPEYFLTLYDIIEAGGYYESYSYIFENLKRLNCSNFPFKNCLIDYKECEEVPFSLDSEQEIHLKNFQWEINDTNQIRAFELALRNKIALIQGPPGTGKSYLGVQIARYLTQIVHNGKPLIVMCYTNHALDQFLEKMLDFTRSVTRIGGRSKNDKLIFCNLSKRTKNVNENLLYREVKQKSEIVSEYLENIMDIVKYPFRKTTMAIRLCDIIGLREIIANGKLKGNIFNTILHMSANIKLYHWLMTDGSFSSIYNGMVDFKKILTEELINVFQLTCIQEKFETTSASKLDSLANLLIRLCIRNKPASFFNQYRTCPEDVEYFIKENLYSNEIAFPLFFRTAVRCAETNAITVDDHCNNLWMLDLNERWKLLCIILFETSELNIANELRGQTFNRGENGRNEFQGWPFFRGVEPFRIKTYEHECKMLKTCQIDSDVNFLQSRDVIGMTTTGAAKNFDLLKKIKPTTYIVEEAAEVFESHIIASLVPDIEHLILIGDHFQLRPSPTIYELAIKYHLDVSLFERLFKNGAPSECLTVQHRMRPDIAKLLIPEFYKSLDNHPSVLEHENIAGVSSNIFFLNHSELENSVDELKSHSNFYEAQLIVTLCEYLISQGHKPSSITILTTYVGQLYLIRRYMREKASIEHVLATTVDNYQGEENDIILVSFVRSNLDNRVGFIKTHNRLCVALSRARKGLYCIGNFKMFASQSSIWKSLLTKLSDMSCFGKKLKVNCCKHPKATYLISTPSDLKTHMKRSCHEPCPKLLPCGHKCNLPCHIKDNKHRKSLCIECKKEKLEKVKTFQSNAEKNRIINSSTLDKTINSSVIEDRSYIGTLHIQNKFTNSLSIEGKSYDNSHSFKNECPANTRLIKDKCHGAELCLVEDKSHLNFNCVGNETDTNSHHVKNESYTGIDHIQNMSSSLYVEDKLIDSYPVKNQDEYRADSHFENGSCADSHFENGSCADSHFKDESSADFHFEEKCHVDSCLENESILSVDSYLENESILSVDSCLENESILSVDSHLENESTRSADSVPIEVNYLADFRPVEDEACADSRIQSKSPVNPLHIKCEPYVDSDSSFQGVNHGNKQKVVLSEDNQRQPLPLNKSIERKKEHTMVLSCGHKITLQSHFWLRRPKCQETVISHMKCGENISHICGEKVNHKNCSSPLQLRCGHTVPCDTNVGLHICSQNANITLQCGHNKSVLCRLTKKTDMKCVVKIKVDLPCGHHASMPCHDSKRENIKCTVEVKVTLPCDHTCKIPCFENNSLDLIKCKELCGSRLQCHHKCSNVCNCCSSSGKHAVCVASLKKQLPCGHILDTKCNTPFKFCRQRCMYRCDHTQCLNPCYVACFPCKKPCTWNCKHHRCDKLCGEICHRPPCNEPCPKRNLSCGHPCSGFCGEPCPKRCLQCKGITGVKKEKLVLLEDCGHSIPYTELNNFLIKHEHQGCPTCPTCHAPITKNVRFGNMLKSYYKSRNETKSKRTINDFPMIKFFQPYVSSFLFEEHVEMIWNDMRMGQSFQGEHYLSRLKVARQLNILFCMMEFEELEKKNNGSKKLYDSLRINKMITDDTTAAIFRVGALLFIQNFTDKKEKAKSGKVNEICENVKVHLEKSPFNTEVVEEIIGIVNSGNEPNCPTLTTFLEFLKKLRLAIA